MFRAPRWIEIESNESSGILGSKVLVCHSNFGLAEDPMNNSFNFKSSGMKVSFGAPSWLSLELV